MGDSEASRGDEVEVSELVALAVGRIDCDGVADADAVNDGVAVELSVAEALL